MLGLLTLLILILTACGARTGLEDCDVDAASPIDASAPVDARRADRFAMPDAFAMPDGRVELACDGLPLPRPGSVRTFEMPGRVDPLGTAIPDPLGSIVVGGGTGDTLASEMLYLDLSAERTQELAVLGDPARLPNGRGVAVYVADGDRVVVVGGRIEDGATDRTFLFTGEGDPTGFRNVRALSLPPYPPGPVAGHVGTYDPVSNRVVIHGGNPEAGTWALSMSGPPSWEQLVDADAGPSAGTRAMGYDPTTHRAIVITDDEDGEGVAVYALTLELGGERWDRLGAIEFVPSVRGELVWDDRACGFHLLSARRTRCVLEHWVLVVAGPRPQTVFRGEVLVEPPHFLAAAQFEPVTSEIVLYGGEDCRELGRPNTTVHAISLVR